MGENKKTIDSKNNDTFQRAYAGAISATDLNKKQTKDSTQNKIEFQSRRT